MSTKHCLTTKRHHHFATQDANTTTSYHRNISSAMYLTYHGINHISHLLTDVRNTLQRERSNHSCCTTSSLFPRSPAIILLPLPHPLPFAHLRIPVRHLSTGVLSIQPYFNVSPTILKHRRNPRTTFPRQFTKRKLPGTPTLFPVHYTSSVSCNGDKR